MVDNPAAEAEPSEGSTSSSSSSHYSYDDCSGSWNDLDSVGDCLDDILLGMECPFTWEVELMPANIRRQMLVYDGGAHSSLWNELMSRLWLAYTDCKQGSHKCSRAAIVEAYMRILPGMHADDELVSDCNAALRHVVDATWAHVCYSQCRGDADAEGTLRTFAETIECSSDMSDQHQAALLAVQAEMTSVPGATMLLKIAIEMQPSEGYWVHMLANLMWFAGRSVFGTKSIFQKSITEKAFALRKCVDTYRVLINVLVDEGEHSRAIELTKEAVQRYPTSAWMLADAAEVMRTLPKPLRNTRMAVRYYERALACPGGDTPYMHYHLAATLVERGELTEARPHLERAAGEVEPAEALLLALDALKKRRQYNTDAFTRGGRNYFGESGPGYFPTHDGRSRP